MLNHEGISGAFSQAAASPAAVREQVLLDALKNPFGAAVGDTVAKVKDILFAMGLPLPEPGAIMAGTEGALLFLDDYGVMLRIERADHLLMRGGRVDDHPMILQPLGSHQVGEHAVIELCPGCDLAQNKDGLKLLNEALPKTGVNLWDRQVGNTGVLPVKTVEFPLGIPVVIDRLAVEKLTNDVMPVAQQIEVLGLSANPQDIYLPLKQAFLQAWPEWQELPDREKYQGFLALCKDFKEQGYLQSGWMQAPQEGARIKPYEDAKRNIAAETGVKYAQQLSSKGLTR